MLETKKPFAAGFALALLAATGCYDFDTAFEDCVKTGQCVPAACDSSAVDVPDDLFYDLNCDEVDGMRDNAVFVDPAGQNSNAGTPAAPLKTLSAALERAATQGKPIYLAQGTYDEENLRMEKPVSIYGGYSGIEGNWKRGKDYITRIGGSTPTGFTVSGLGDASVVIERVHIRSSSSTAPGTPSIGLRVMDSSGVRLRHVLVEAGAGAPGQAGASPGANTQVGADGGVGLDGSAATPSGGPRGTSSCGTGSYAGGIGGQGGISYGTAPASGAPGEPTTGGGSPGTNKLTTDVSMCGTHCVCVGEAGGEGQPGATGDTGEHGIPGDGTGVLEGTTWVAKSGSDGKAGTLGKGGGGGGGGGYCEAPAAQSKGGGGGGGGAGGCPGAGAKGGQGGGASIALLLLRGHVAMESCTLKTGGGGKGGAGGTGGAGGAGGQGGAGGKGILMDASSPGNYTYQATGGVGGKGGKGGDGGPGGHGGNGGGGPSVGVWCDGPESSSVTQTGTAFDLEDAGAPGSGPGTRGNTGLLTNYHLCPGSP